MTAQAGDAIILDGVLRALCALPLDVLFRSMLSPPRFRMMTTANWRGYIAKWKIEDRQLLLVDLHGKLDMNPRTAHVEETDESLPGLDRPDPREEHAHLIAKIEALPINSLGLRLSDATWTGWSIPGDNGFADLGEASRVTVKRLLNSAIEPLMASWYTGILRISEGELLRYEHLGFGSEYERDQLIEIVAGSAARLWTVDNRPGYEARSTEIRTKPSGWPRF